MSQAKVRAGGIIRKSLDQTWRTPERILDCARSFLGDPIPLDAATAIDNPTRADRYCVAPDEPQLFRSPMRVSLEPAESVVPGLRFIDGLSMPWPVPWWCNPPYGAALKTWLAKMRRESPSGVRGLALLPACRWEMNYFTETLAAASAICLIRGRVAFISSRDNKPVGGNPFASMILGFNARAGAFRTAFGELGACFSIRSIGTPAEEAVRTVRRAFGLSPERRRRT